MNSKYNIEEIKHNLPDYISNNIKDEDLVTAIENELRTNVELQIEIEELKGTFGFLKNSSLDAPPNNYFANLPVKINQRIEQNEEPAGILDRISLFWKILIPAIPVIIVIGILLFNNSKNDPEQIQSTKTETNIEEPLKKSETVENKTNKVESNTNISKEIVKHNRVGNRNTNRINNDYLISDKVVESEAVEIPEIKEKLSQLIADNISTVDDTNNDVEVDVMYTNDGDDESEDEIVEDEFQNLTPEEQKEIIDNLLKTQI